MPHFILVSEQAPFTEPAAAPNKPYPLYDTHSLFLGEITLSSLSSPGSDYNFSPDSNLKIKSTIPLNSLTRPPIRDPISILHHV